MSKPMFAWREAILKSDLPPTTRHVLLTLACHMTPLGEDCFPSIQLLCEETGLSNRAVITHLQNATELGWITVSLRGLEGQRWKSHEYHPAWPPYLKDAAERMEEAMNLVRNKAVNHVHQVQKGSEPNDRKAVNVIQKGSEPNDRKAVNVVHTSTSYSSSSSTSLSTSVNPSSPQKNGEEEKIQSVCRETWKSYSNAYFNRYQTEPIRNASVNTFIKTFCKKIPHHEAPHVAAFFVAHNDKFYIQKTHHPSLLSKDAEGLRTQWATGRTMTATKANQLDKTASNFNSVTEAIEMLREKNRASI